MSELAFEEILKINDIQRKMKIVKNVVTACCAEKDANVSYLTSVANNKNSISIVNSIRYYTGLDLKTITTYLNQYLQKPPTTRTFTEYHEKYSKNSVDDKIWDQNLRDGILAQYLKGFAKVTDVETSKQRELIPQAKCFDEEKMLINSILISENSFYMPHKIEGTSKIIIIERPERSQERFRYLEAMARYRSSDLNVVYVNFNKLGAVGRFFWNYIVVCPKEGVLGTFKANKTHEKKKFKELESWILNEILPQLLSPSVLVLEDEIGMSDSITVPTIRSLKVDMLQWLTVNNIVHRREMHRAELYALIKKSKRHLPDTICTFDTLVNARGHKVLRQPKGVMCLNFFEKVWVQQLQVLAPITDNLAKAFYANDIVNRRPEQWQHIEAKLIQMEKKIYSEDIALEHVIDKILTLGKYSPESKDLFEQFEDAPKDWKIFDMIEMNTNYIDNSKFNC